MLSLTRTASSLMFSVCPFFVFNKFRRTVHVVLVVSLGSAQVGGSTESSDMSSESPDRRPIVARGGSATYRARRPH
eukprot:COSAG02_NODE_2914_length_7755_cov_1036.500000_5_plen_76_part_00